MQLIVAIYYEVNLFVLKMYFGDQEIYSKLVRKVYRPDM